MLSLTMQCFHLLCNAFTYYAMLSLIVQCFHLLCNAFTHYASTLLISSQAWLYTIEHGVHTEDIFKAGTSLKKVGTKQFTQEVIANLGKTPKTLKVVDYGKVS